MKKFVLFGLLCAAAFGASVEAVDAYVRESFSKNSAAYVKLKNNGKTPVSLVAAVASASNVTEIHNVIAENGMKKMVPVEKVVVEAGEVRELKPGGYHIMLIGLKHTLKEGKKMRSLTLKFDNGEKIVLKNVPVKKLTSGGMNSTMHGGGMHGSSGNSSMHGGGMHGEMKH